MQVDFSDYIALGITVQNFVIIDYSKFNRKADFEYLPTLLMMTALFGTIFFVCLDYSFD